jgi:hypothetical protein
MGPAEEPFKYWPRLMDGRGTRVWILQILGSSIRRSAALEVG